MQFYCISFRKYYETPYSYSFSKTVTKNQKDSDIPPELLQPIFNAFKIDFNSKKISVVKYVYIFIFSYAYDFLYVVHLLKVIKF